MRDTFLPFSRPSITEEDIAAVGDVLRSGWITTGPHAAELERRFSEITGSPGAVAVSSATGGMHLTLRALGIVPGDEVITSSLTWVSTVNLIVLAGAKPVFADVDRDTLMITPETIQPCLSERTRLIVPVHFGGAPADLDGIEALARRHNASNPVAVVWDAAHAVGTRYRDEPIGQRGTSIFSFHPIKNITTGEGGLITSDDEAFLERIRRLKFHGLGVDAFDRTVQGRSPQAEVQEPGFKYNLPDLGAVLGVRQLARLDAMNARRAELAACYRERLALMEGILPLGDPPYDHHHAWHLFVVRVDPERAGLDRDTFMTRLKAKNIGTGLHFRAVHLHRYYLEQGGTHRGMLPATEWNSDRICSLPLFPDMTSQDLDDVVTAMGEVLDG